MIQLAKFSSLQNWGVEKDLRHSEEGEVPGWENALISPDAGLSGSCGVETSVPVQAGLGRCHVRVNFMSPLGQDTVRRY